MATGQRASMIANRCGKDFWSRRYPHAAGTGPWAKRLTHRYERQQLKREIRRAADLQERVAFLEELLDAQTQILITEDQAWDGRQWVQIPRTAH